MGLNLGLSQISRVATAILRAGADRLRVAILTEWLTVFGGAERVLAEVLAMYPHADVFALIDAMPSRDREFLGDRPVRTSFLQRIPLRGRFYRKLLPLMPAAVEALDFSGYDLLVSCSHAVAKGALTSPEQVHLTYMQARGMKYLYEDRLHYQKLGVAKSLMSSSLRVWDAVAARRPDATVANSEYVRRWHYHRHGVESTVVYPPVDVELFGRYAGVPKADYFVTGGRLEPYKRFELVIEAFNTLGYPLVVLGDGTRARALKAMARRNVTFAGSVGAVDVARVVGRARAFVYAGKEDFGISLVESQAAGTPVVAVAAGGAVETVRPLGQSAPTGLLVANASVDELVGAVQEFAGTANRIRMEDLIANASKYSRQVFRRGLGDAVDRALRDKGVL